VLCTPVNIFAIRQIFAKVFIFGFGAKGFDFWRFVDVLIWLFDLDFNKKVYF